MANAIVRSAEGAFEERAKKAGSKAVKKSPAKKALAKEVHAAKKGAKGPGKKAAKHAPDAHGPGKHGPDAHGPKKHGPGKHDADHHGQEQHASGKRHGPGKLVRMAAEGARGKMDREELMAAAYHHLQRSAAVISLLGGESGGDLRMLLDRGVARFKEAATKEGRRSAKGAFCLLCAAEHLGMAGLYSARTDFRIDVPAMTSEQVTETLRSLPDRLDAIRTKDRKDSARLLAMVVELARRADAADHDLHLQFELTLAAHWICVTIEKELL